MLFRKKKNVEPKNDLVNKIEVDRIMIERVSVELDDVTNALLRNNEKLIQSMHM